MTSPSSPDDPPSPSSFFNASSTLADSPPPSKSQIKRATRTRRNFTILSSVLLLVSVVFLILVIIGTTSANAVGIRDIYFLKLDLRQILPASVPDTAFVNTIAQTLGLHDFYQVGLWNFCEGYQGDGITHCSEPVALYWFDPVSIIKKELLSGASS
jgi:hypothetical protein